MSNKISDLDPQMQPLVRTFISLIPVPFAITSTLRTVDEQIAYYAQGRATLAIVNLLRQRAGLPATTESENQKIITQCDGINTLSNHQGGKAIDVVPTGMNGQPIWPHPADPRWEKIMQASEAAGLSPGGRWPKPDYPHHEMKGA